MPKSQLAARGSWKAKSRPSEPEAVEGVPVKPEWLGLIASAKWDEIVPALVKQGVMAVLYGDFISMYCQAHQDFHDAMAIIKREGLVCFSEKGGAYQHPAVGIKQNAIREIARFGSDFGMSASSIRDVIKTPDRTAKRTLSSAARKR